MRKGWEIKKLGEVCDLTRGQNPPKSKFISEPKEGYVRFYQIRDGWADDYVVYVPDSPQLHKVEPKDMLMVAYRHIGKVFRGVTGAFNVALCKIANSRLDLLDDDFLFYMIPTDLIRGELMKRSERSLIPSMSIEHLKEIQIPIPPLPEQQRIVSILDEAFSSIEQAKENLQRNLQNAKELFQSEMNSIFTNKGEGWQEKTLKEVSLEFGRGKSKHRPRGDESLLGGDFPLIQTGEISNSNHWITSFSQTYNEKGLAQSKLWKKGTICIAIVGANVAETGILTFDACFPDSVIGIVVNPKYANNQYVEYLLQTFKAYLKEKGKGTARDNINMGTFENQKFPFPNVETQQKIVQQLDKLSTETERLEAMYQQKLDALEELKKSILQKAFSGELSECLCDG